MSYAKFVVLAVVLSLYFVGCGGSTQADIESPGEEVKAPCPDCEAGKTSSEPFWCESCGVGHANGETITCKACFDAKITGTGWCDTCQKGYVDGKEKTCKGCVEAAKNNTECEACKGKHAH